MAQNSKVEWLFGPTLINSLETLFNRVNSKIDNKKQNICLALVFCCIIFILGSWLLPDFFNHNPSSILGLFVIGWVAYHGVKKFKQQLTVFMLDTLLDHEAQKLVHHINQSFTKDERLVIRLNLPDLFTRLPKKILASYNVQTPEIFFYVQFMKRVNRNLLVFQSTSQRNGISKEFVISFYKRTELKKTNSSEASCFLAELFEIQAEEIFKTSPSLFVKYETQILAIQAPKLTDNSTINKILRL